MWKDHRQKKKNRLSVPIVMVIRYRKGPLLVWGHCAFGILSGSAVWLSLPMEKFWLPRPGIVRFISGIRLPDGRSAAICYHQIINLWSLATGQRLQVLKGHLDTVYSAAFSTDGQLLGSASADGTIRLWNTKTGKELHCLKGQKGYVYSIAFIPDGKMLFSRQPGRGGFFIVITTLSISVSVKKSPLPT
jgi:hypothetical protein